MDKTCFEQITARFEKQLIPLKEVSAYLGVDYRTLKKQKGFPVRKVGRLYYVPAVALAKWMS